MRRKSQESVAHTYFLAGDYPGAIKAYGDNAYYLDAAAWAALGEKKRAIGLLREGLRTKTLAPLMTALLGSLVAALENKRERALRIMEGADTKNEPEIQVYLARHYAALGQVAAAMGCLEGVAQPGFVCSPKMLLADPWFRPLKEYRRFKSFLVSCEEAVKATEQSLRFELPHGLGLGPRAVTLFGTALAVLFHTTPRKRSWFAVVSYYIYVFSYGELRLQRIPDAPQSKSRWRIMLRPE